MAVSDDKRVMVVAIPIFAMVFLFLAGGAFATDAPAPSPTAGAASLSTPVLGAVLCSIMAMLLGSLRQ
ncbi:Arabinogalactan peptide 3 [Rhynchospora pubera]|uniref:Arabinogalactan peptide 3 n=1 Tax=Rhynchospora pubera TaxID=906938 RepID=A0AAV8F6P7_9POAL|nr:Arabinogalactan peptide 3 [Rhynchospora pubera]